MIFCTFYWMSPAIQIRFYRDSSTSSRFMRRTGAFWGISWARYAKGITFREVPIIMARSHSSISLGAAKKDAGSCSPKKTMSGLTYSPHSQIMGSHLEANFFHYSMLAYFLQPRQCALLLWPCAWRSLSQCTPALIYRSSMFWVMFMRRMPSSCSLLMNLWPRVGSKSFVSNSFARVRKAVGWSLKQSMENMAYGYGSLYSCSLLQSPVPGLRKSGIPAATLRPAPVRTTTFLYFFYRRPSITSEKVTFRGFSLFSPRTLNRASSLLTSSCLAYSSLSFSQGLISIGFSQLAFSSVGFSSLILMLLRVVLAGRRWYESMQLSQLQHQYDPSVRLRAMECLLSSLCWAMCPFTQREQWI